MGTNKKKKGASAPAVDEREEGVEGGSVEGGGMVAEGVMGDGGEGADIVEEFEFSSDESDPEIA